MVSVTGTFKGLPPVPGTMIVTTPLYVPCTNADPFTETVTILPDTAAESQPVPLNVVAAAATVAPDGTPFTVIVWLAGADAPTAWVKLKLVGVALIFDETITNVT